MAFTGQSCSTWGGLSLGPFLKPFQALLAAAVTQGRECSRGTGYGRRLEKQHVAVAEGGTTTEKPAREKGELLLALKES